MIYFNYVFPQRQRILKTTAVREKQKPFN